MRSGDTGCRTLVGLRTGRVGESIAGAVEGVLGHWMSKGHEGVAGGLVERKITVEVTHPHHIITLLCLLPSWDKSGDRCRGHRRAFPK